MPVFISKYPKGNLLADLSFCEYNLYMKYLTQSAVLLFSTILVLIIAETPLSPYIPAFLALIVIISTIYAIILRRKRRGQEVFLGNNKEVFTIIVFVLLIIFLTGGIRSPIFFLTYFIFFGLAFIFEPIMIFFFLLCLIGIFVPQAIQDDIFGNILKLLSLLFLSPIAYFFGREYKRRERIKQKIKDSTESIIDEAKDMIKTKDKNERLRKAEEIIETAHQLQKEIKE
jgi:hypothetical protein